MKTPEILGNLFRRAAPYAVAGSLLVAASCSSDSKSVADENKDTNARIEQLNEQIADAKADKEARKAEVVAKCLPVAETAVQDALVADTTGITDVAALTPVFDAYNGEEGETAGQTAMDACTTTEFGEALPTDVETSVQFVDGKLDAVVAGQ